MRRTSRRYETDRAIEGLRCFIAVEADSNLRALREIISAKRIRACDRATALELLDNISEAVKALKPWKR